MIAGEQIEVASALPQVTPQANGIGAEVAGIDLSRPLDPAQIDALETALVAHKVLLFRDQDMTTEQHIALGRQFGPLEIHPFAELGSFQTHPDHPEVIMIESVSGKGTVAEKWHSDVSFRATPALGSILKMTHCPESGGDTLWADMEAAYDGLDDKTRSLLSGLVAIHDWHTFRNKLVGRGMPADQIAALVKQHPPAEHPVVRTHPVSGRKIIYVNSTFTVGIKGMRESESNELLARLYKLADSPEYHARMVWRPGSVAFWDNRSTQHSVIPGEIGHRRLERVTVAGDRPF